MMAPNSNEFLHPPLSVQPTNSIIKYMSSSSSAEQESTASSSHEEEEASTESPLSPMDWPNMKTPKFATHRGRISHDVENETINDSNKRSVATPTMRDHTTLKDVFSCAKPRATSPLPEEEEEEHGMGHLQIKNNVEVFLDGLVNGFWQCQGSTDAASVTSDLSTRATCRQALSSFQQSTQTMEFHFVPLSGSRSQSKTASSAAEEEEPKEYPPLPSSSSRHSHTPPIPQQIPKKAVGKMFKRIRVKRGENIGLELFQYNKSIYINQVAKEGTGLKRGMRIIAINDHPCPDSVAEAIDLLAYDNDTGYVTFVTGEEYDFENAPSVIGGGGDEEDAASLFSDTYSIRSSMGYV